MQPIVLTGECRDNLVRSLQKHGSFFQYKEDKELWIQDGKIWSIDRNEAVCLGDYFLYLEENKPCTK